MRQVMFEVFGVPAAYALSSPVAALYGAGRTTGVLVDVGDSGTRVSVVIGGAPLRRASRASTVGGRRVAEVLSGLLAERGVTLPGGASGARAAAEAAAYVSSDYYGDLGAADAERFALRYTPPPPAAPSGGLAATAPPPPGPVVLKTERFRAGEVLFQPSLAGVDEDGVARLVQAAIKCAPVEERGGLYANIVVAGGGSCLRGFPERLGAEISMILGGDYEPVVAVAPAARGDLAWRGGAALGGLGGFRGMWVTREEYRELGAVAAVARRCF